ncbi:MAG: GNAT family N-acetyltransferase [Oscillospiraceae bacterium]|nr:GNAT family N-acetyltransferase [Oscillospiraceae bacterium]
MTEEIEIRPAVIADSDDICRLSAEELGYPYPPGKTREKLARLLESAADRIFVAVCGGRVVGYIHACDYDVLYAPHMKNIMGIAVSSDHRRGGIGKALMSAVEQWAAETGAEAIRLNSGKTREGAHAFYRSIGFNGDKEQLNFKKYLS